MRFLCFVFLGFILCEPLWAEGEGFGQVTKAEGKVRVTRRFKKITPKPDTKLLEKDLVKTGDASSLDIAIDEDNNLHIGPKSSMKLIKEKKSKDDQEIIIELMAGTLRSKLDDLKGQTFRVRSPVAVVGVRGTDFVSSYQPELGPKAFAVTVIEGRVEVSVVDAATKALGQATLVQSSQQIQISKTGRIVVVQVPAQQMEEFKRTLPITEDKKAEDAKNNNGKAPAKDSKEKKADKKDKDSEKEKKSEKVDKKQPQEKKEEKKDGKAQKQSEGKTKKEENNSQEDGQSSEDDKSSTSDEDAAPSKEGLPEEKSGERDSRDESATNSESTYETTEVSEDSNAKAASSSTTAEPDSGSSEAIAPAEGTSVSSAGEDSAAGDSSSAFTGGTVAVDSPVEDEATLESSPDMVGSSLDTPTLDLSVVDTTTVDLNSDLTSVQSDLTDTVQGSTSDVVSEVTDSAIQETVTSQTQEVVQQVVEEQVQNVVDEQIQNVIDEIQNDIQFRQLDVDFYFEY